MRLPVITLFFALTFGVTAEAKGKWFEARSEHFTVVSNGSRGRAKAILEDLEQLRRLMAELLPAKPVDSVKPAVFTLFKNEKSMRPFQPIVAGEREDWYGMYRPTSFQDLVLLRGDGAEDSVRKMAFGQYMHLLGSYVHADYPVWLSNGLSLFYGNTEISKKRASIGKMREEYRRVLGQFRSVPVRELFAVDRSSSYYRDLKKRPMFDAQSWALVHYLLIGRAQENGPARMSNYLLMLRQDREPLLAFQEAMGKTLDEIDSDVSRYIRKNISQYLRVDLPPLEMDKDIQITKLPEAAAEAHVGLLFMATRHDDEAEASLSSSVEADPDQVSAYETLANLRERQDKSAEAAGFLERAIQRGSTNPYVRLRYAQLFVNSHAGASSPVTPETAAPVMESLRLVIRDAPELTDAARLFGFLSLFSSDTHEEARQVVTDALEKDRGNPGLVFILGQLHAKGGNYAAARAIYQQLLNRRLDQGFNASVRRQYDYVDARLKFEARKAAAAARGNDVAAGTEIVEVRGKLVLFDCTEGHRFIVADGKLVYALDIIDLARVEIREKGKRADTRDFACGPLDENVVVRYIPAPRRDVATERYGRLVAIDFLGS